MELLKTEGREIVSARLLVRFLRTVRFVLQEHCGKAQGLFQQPVFLVLREPFLMPDVNLLCVTETVACCHFHRGPEEQTVSSLQQIFKYVKAVVLALLGHCLFWSGEPRS